MDTLYGRTSAPWSIEGGISLEYIIRCPNILVRNVFIVGKK